VQPGVGNFNIWLGEPKCLPPGTHPAETAGYIVLESGQSADHAAGTHDVGSAWVTVPIPDLGPNPIIIVGTQSGNLNAGFSQVRLRSVQQSSFQAKVMIAEESPSSTVALETIGYLVLRTDCTQSYCGCSENHESCVAKNGTVSIDGRSYTYEAGFVYTKNTRPESSTDGRSTTVQFKAATFSQQPVLMVNIQTYKGSDPASVRIGSVSTTSFDFIIDEDECKDTEKEHASEWVAYYAFAEQAV